MKNYHKENTINEIDNNYFLKVSGDTLIKINSSEINILKKEMGREADNILSEFLIFMNPYTKLYAATSNKTEMLISLLLIFVETNFEDMINGGKSLCSHSQGYFTFFKNNEEVEEYYNRIFEQHRHELSKIFNNIPYVKKEIFYQKYCNFIPKLKQEVQSKIECQKIIFKNNKDDLSNQLNKSKFHKDLLVNPNWEKSLNSISFKCSRFMTICQYEYLYCCLGIDYKVRTLLCYMAYKIIEIEKKYKYF